MGIAIKSKRINLNMGYGGFMRLRRTIANLCPDEIKDQYNYMVDNYTHLLYHADELKAFDEKTEKIYEKNKTKYGKVMDFLWAPDTDAKLSYGTAKQLLKIIGDFDDGKIYGYAGWGKDAARFSDFKNLLKDCVETKSSLKWD